MDLFIAGIFQFIGWLVLVILLLQIRDFLKEIRDAKLGNKPKKTKAELEKEFAESPAKEESPSKEDGPEKRKIRVR